MKKISIIFLFLSTAFISSMAQSQYGAWTYSAAITINTSPDGANLPGGESVQNYPLVIRLEKGSFDFSQANAVGNDIRFEDATGSSLAYQIEEWDNQIESGIAWVKIPQIDGNSMLTIKMYWGNTNAVSESNRAALFDVNAGFDGVWHLNEEANNDSAGFKDATLNNAHGTGNNMGTISNTYGVIGAAINFVEDSAQRIVISQPSLFNYITQMSVSFWLKGSQFVNPKEEPILGRQKGFSVITGGNKGNVIFHPGNASTNTNIEDNGWHHIFVNKRDSNDQEIIFDGSNIRRSVRANLAEVSNNPLILGGININGITLNGQLDEVWVSRVPRDSNWAKISYESQRIDQQMVSAPIPANCVKDFSFGQPSFEILESNSTMIWGKSNCATRVEWYKLGEGGQEVWLDGGNSLNYAVGRVSKDSAITLRFKALYNGVWESKDVILAVKNTIPDPVFTLESPLAPGQVWDGVTPLAFKVNVSNIDAINALAYPMNNITYFWERTGAPVSVTTDWLANYTLNNLTDNTGGLQTVNLKVCLDNRSDVQCDSISIQGQIGRTGVVANIHDGSIGIRLVGNQLHWKSKTQIKIWDPQGKLILKTSGNRGDKLEITPQLKYILMGHPQLIRVIELK